MKWKWVLKAIHYTTSPYTVCPSRFALVSLHKHTDKDSSFQVSCNVHVQYAEIFSSKGGSAILMNMSFLTPFYVQISVAGQFVP